VNAPVGNAASAGGAAPYAAAPLEPSPAEQAAAGSVKIQAGAYSAAANVDDAIARLSRIGFNPLTENAGGLTRVCVFVAPAQEADALARLRAAGYGDAFIRR
jgi:cell division septation protein DedD